jgi:hypothetical protein
MSILSDLLPIGASILGGPIAGAATKWLADKLGLSDSTITSVTDALQGVDPLERAKLEQEFLKWSIQEQNRMWELELKDKESARTRDTAYIVSGSRNYRADLMFLLAVTVICGLVWIVWKDSGINEYVKGIFTLVLGRFLGYLDNIYNFEFGTTRSSKTKDATIENLSKKEDN